MPADVMGQMVSFAAEIDPDSKFHRYAWIKARRNDTVKAIAARRGHPELAAEILKLNKGRDVLVHPKRKAHQKVHHVPKLTMVTQKLRGGVSIRLPGNLIAGEVVNVHAGDQPPVVRDGYAKYDTVDRPNRIGINRFLGYNPIVVDIPIQFESYSDQVGHAIERDIQKLERFAGRGDYPGAANGPPAVLRITTTDAGGSHVPLFPLPYQNSNQNKNAPLFRISAIAWDQAALRNDLGYRVRQGATVTVTQYTPLRFVVRSVAQRTLNQPGKSHA
jgi:hypothetical protein